MVARSIFYQLGDLVRVKTGDETLIGQPSDDAKGKSGTPGEGRTLVSGSGGRHSIH